jgi:hypothetical protein
VARKFPPRDPATFQFLEIIMRRNTLICVTLSIILTGVLICGAYHDIKEESDFYEACKLSSGVPVAGRNNYQACMRKDAFIKITRQPLSH